MSSTTSVPPAHAGSAAGLQRLWRRDLSHYPTGSYRVFLLALVVLANIMFTWTVSAGSAATTVMLPHFGISVNFYSDLLVVAGIIGGLASYISSFGDRWGRANLVVIGLLVNALFALVAIPDAPNKYWFYIFTCVLYLADGAIFVGTPALVRDFSPQLQRGLAMGFWTFGPVAGYFVLSAVAHAYLPATALPTFANWQGLYRFAGYGALVMFVICLLFLRELPAGIRSQRMAAMNERVLVELRSRGLDLVAATKNRWRQMIHVNTIASAIAINLFLVIYFTAIAYFVFYFTEFLHFSLSSFNGIQEIYWGVNIAMLVVWGLLSDWLKVRKPFMVLGALGTIGCIIWLMTVRAGVSFGTMALITSLLGASLACGYCPWFASYTETLEARNPALIATGTSLYGFATRLVLVPFGLIIPHIIGSPVQTVGGWRTWFYVCIATVVVFVPFIWTMSGRWSPAAARADFEAHEAEVNAEIEQLRAAAAAQA